VLWIENLAYLQFSTGGLMIGRSSRRTGYLTAFSLIILAPTVSSAVSLHVSTATTHPGNTISVQITVDQPAEIAAALLAVQYNTDYLTLTSVASPFFSTFSEQWQSLSPVPDPLPPSEIVVDGVTYASPVVYKVSEGKALLAGARVKAGQSATTLFQLSFTVADNTPDATYPLAIAAVTMNNESCGYPASGETLPLLTGATEGENTFPDLPVSLTDGAVIVYTFSDTDQDGIDDVLEEQMFGDLETANAFTDYDHDGYTDLQEYLNSFAGEVDPEGNPYNPKEKNAPSGTGYRTASARPWIQLLLN
jgi:hypothetical protein